MTMTVDGNKTAGARNYPVKRIDWNFPEAPKKNLGYSLEAILVKDEEVGGYVASISQLAGVVSEGDNAASAICNLMEAFLAVIETYEAEGMRIPWRNSPPREPKEDRFQIVVPCPDCR